MLVGDAHGDAHHDPLGHPISESCFKPRRRCPSWPAWGCPLAFLLGGNSISSGLPLLTALRRGHRGPRAALTLPGGGDAGAAMTVQIALDGKSSVSSPARASLLLQGPLLGRSYKFARADINVRQGGWCQLRGSRRNAADTWQHAESRPVGKIIRRYLCTVGDTRSSLKIPSPNLCVRLERLIVSTGAV